MVVDWVAPSIGTEAKRQTDHECPQTLSSPWRGQNLTKFSRWSESLQNSKVLPVRVDNTVFSM